MRDDFSARYVERVSRLAALFVLLATFLVGLDLRAAEPRTVLLIGAEEPLRDAVATALASWDLRIVPVSASPPAATMPRAARDARVLTAKYGAAGVVWIAASEDEDALHVYDADSDQLLSRSLTKGRNFDAATAASAALTVKTLLRSSRVAPPSERIGAEARPTPPPPPSNPFDGPAEPDHAMTPPPRPPPIALGVELGAAARALAGEIDTRVSAGGGLYFGPSRRWGVGLAARTGPGLDVSAARFQGRFDETAVVSSLRHRFPLGARLVLEPRLGSTLHVTRIEGIALAPARPAKEHRVDVSADGALVFDVLLGSSIRVGLDAEAAYVLRYQRYLVGTEPVFDLAPLQASLGLHLGVGVL